MHVAVAPPRTDEQRLASLAIGNAVRTNRSVLKRELRDRETYLLEVLNAGKKTDWLEGMRVRDVLLAVPQLGKGKVNRLMGFARISNGKTLGALTDRQRTDLLDRIRNWHPTVRVAPEASW